jgi:hypothetical protein
VERDRSALITNTFTQLNNQYSRRNSNTPGTPLAVSKVKVTFKDEPGEGSGVARSFYTAISMVSGNTLSMGRVIQGCYVPSSCCVPFTFGPTDVLSCDVLTYVVSRF